MSAFITQAEVRDEQDVIHVRQRAHLIAQLLGYDRNDQTRIATAVAEIARNACQYAGGGEVQFDLEGETPPQVLAVTVRDAGPGIEDVEGLLREGHPPPEGTGLGIAGVRRLMDHFRLESRPGSGTTVFLGRTLPAGAPPVTAQTLERIRETLLRARPVSPLEEVRLQNRELLRTLEELRRRQQELIRANRELEDTNRGMLALYAELDEKAVQLARANELRAHFLSNMSHEFRTPLNSILALSQLLLDRIDGDLTAEQEKQVSFIRRAAQDLSALVDDLLDLARLEAGKTPVRAREFTAEEIFSGLRGMLKPLLAKPAVNLVFEDPCGIPPLYTDDSKVSQILRNFLSNALKFTDQGEVRVSARLQQDGKSVVFSVADTGIGIAPEDQKRIFDEYVQIEQTQPSKSGGIGLGLAIARKLAELLGGTVGLESRPGAGSTFFASIPLRYEEPRPAAPESAVDSVRHQVLVVEDDPATQLLYEKYLKGAGFHTLPALSIKAARGMLKSVKPLAVVLDILMPGEDAWQFLAEFKAAEATRAVPVIIASVLPERDAGMALGAEDYCVKPVERAWLLEKLRAVSRRVPVEKILVVDDDEAARYILKGHLADTKFTIIEAADGPEALRLAEAERPELIVLDLVMPGMSGFEVLRRLRENPATSAIPVIVHTAKTLDEKERAALNQQALAVLSKGASSREATLKTVAETLRKAAELQAVRERELHG